MFSVLLFFCKGGSNGVMLRGNSKRKMDILGLGRKPLDRNFVVSFLETGRYPQEHLLGALGQLAFFDLVLARFEIIQIYWMVTCIQPLLRIFACFWRRPERPCRLRSLLHRWEGQESPYVSETPLFPVPEVFFAAAISFTNKCEGRSHEWRKMCKSKTACFQ